MSVPVRGDIYPYRSGPDQILDGPSGAVLNDAHGLDGAVHQRRKPADLNGTAWVLDKPFFLALDLAVGGSWSGDPDGSTSFPPQLVVDHVRVTTGDWARMRTGGGHSRSGPPT